MPNPYSDTWDSRAGNVFTALHAVTANLLGACLPQK